MSTLVEAGYINGQESEPTVKDLLEAKWSEGKFLCVGLDVSADEELGLYEKAKLIVDATRDIAAAYKPNSAFYEGESALGISELEQLVSYIKELAPDVSVIWDAKRGDIAKTNEGYDKAAKKLGVDGITIHPYLGGTAVEPLLSDKKRAGFVLAHTSNPGAFELQHLELKSGELLWERVVNNVSHSEDWHYESPLGIVTGATYPEELAKARHLAGDEIIMLIPGVGTQGGDLEASVRGAMNSQGNGFLINVSSGISGAKDSNNHVTYDSIRSAAISFHEQIREVWSDAITNPTPNYPERQMLEFDSRLASALYDEDCIKFGSFQLRNGSESPIYINLRSSITNPTLRSNISQIYVDMIRRQEEYREEPYDLVGGIPQAATSYAAIVSERMNRRLIQPRVGDLKDHGMPTLVEGRFNQGESVVLLDDLITDGGAKFDVIGQVESAGLSVGGIAVLVDREQGGSERLIEAGYTLTSSTTLRGLVIALAEDKKISDDLRDRTLEYLNS